MIPENQHGWHIRAELLGYRVLGYWVLGTGYWVLGVPFYGESATYNQNSSEHIFRAWYPAPGTPLLAPLPKKRLHLFHAPAGQNS